MKEDNKLEKISVVDYFFRGFSLLNRNIELYLIAFLFTLASFFLQYLNKLPFPLGLIISVIYLIVTVFSLSYTLSIPVLLEYKQQGKSLNYNNLWKIIIQNAKRLIIPVMVLIPIATIAFVIISIIVIKSLNVKNTGEFIKLIYLIYNIQLGWNPIYIIFISIFTIIFSFFIFTSIFFSIENLGIFSAWSQSITFSFKNMRFMGLVIAVALITNSVAKFIISAPFDRIFVSYLSLIPAQYVSLALISSSLLYYKDRQGKH